MMLPAGVVQSIDANIVDLDDAWIFADQDIWSQDYAEVLLQPISVEAVDINDLRFKATEVVLEIRATTDPASAVIWSGYAETVDDAGGGGVIGLESRISCGVIDPVPPVFVDNGNGTASIFGFRCAIRPVPDYTQSPSDFEIAPATLTFPDGVESYACVAYIAGTPTLYAETNKYAINGSDVVLIFVVWRTGNELHSISTDSRGIGLADKIAGMITRTKPYSLMYGQQLTLGVVATPAVRTVTIAAAVMYAGVDAVPLATFNSSNPAQRLTRVAPTAGVYGFLNQTQLDNTSYSDGTNVVALGSNRYSPRWVYRTVGDDAQAFYALGGEYTNIASAQAAPIPTGLPIVVQNHAVLVGRIIIQAGVDTPVQIDQVESTTFSTSTANMHNNLDGLQGTGPDYYHMDVTRWTNTGNGPWLPLTADIDNTLTGKLYSNGGAEFSGGKLFLVQQGSGTTLAQTYTYGGDLGLAGDNGRANMRIMGAIQADTAGVGPGLSFAGVATGVGPTGGGMLLQFTTNNGLDIYSWNNTAWIKKSQINSNGMIAVVGGTAAGFLKANGTIDTNTYLTGITLSGDVTGSGAATITTAIAAATVTGKVLTGYTVGSNTAIAATDTILAAFGKTQAQINTHTSQFANYVLKAGDTMSGTLNITLSSAASNIVLTNSGASATATLTTTLTGMDASVSFNTKTSNWVLGPSDAGTKGIPVGAFALRGPAAGGTAYWYQTTSLFQHLTNVGITGRLAVSSYPVFFGATLQSWGSGRNATTLGGTVSVEQVNTGSGDYYIVHNNCYFDGANNRSISATGACSQIALTPTGGFSFDSFANNGANGIVSATTKFGIDSSGNGTFVGSVTSSNGTGSAQMAPYLSSTAAWFGYSGLNTGASTGAGFWAWSDGGVGIDTPSARTIALRVAGANKVTVSSTTATFSALIQATGYINTGTTGGLTSPGANSPLTVSGTSWTSAVIQTSSSGNAASLYLTTGSVSSGSWAIQKRDDQAWSVPVGAFAILDTTYTGTSTAVFPLVIAPGASGTITMNRNLSVNGAVDAGRARMQSSAYTSTDAWFGLAGQNTSDYNSQNGLRCELTGPRLHCPSGATIPLIVNGVAALEATGSGVNVVGSIFMLSSGGGAYNTTGIFSTGSGINISRPRASDSASAAILSFTVGQRGGGTSYFEVADGYTYNRQVVQNETLVRVGSSVYGSYATLLGNWTSAYWWGIGAATTGTDSTLKIGSCNSGDGSWVSGSPITLQVDGVITTTSGNSIQSGGGFLTSASGVFLGYGLNVKTATINPGVDAGYPFFVDRGAARQLLTRGVSISAASNVYGYANPRIELADGSSVMSVDNYQQTFRIYASTSVGSATVMLSGNAAGMTAGVPTKINEIKRDVNSVASATTLGGLTQLLYVGSSVDINLGTDTATVGSSWDICVIGTGSRIVTGNLPTTIYFDGRSYFQSYINLTQYRAYRLHKTGSSTYFLM